MSATSIRFSLASAVLALGLGVTGESLAASFNVDPVTFTMSASQASAVIRIGNADQEPVRIQVTPVSWVLQANEEHEEPSDQLILNPPIFSVAAQKTQFVRFGLRERSSAERELAYRLIIEEVPDPNQAPQPGLRTVLRLSVPVFVAPAKPLKHLRWQLVNDARGSTLSVVNDGNVHQRLIKLTLDAEHHSTNLSSAAFYLLPNERREWTMPALDSPSARINVTNEQGVEEQVLVSADQHP